MGPYAEGTHYWIGVKVARSSENAEELENALLDRYDYAWNERRNGDIYVLYLTEPNKCPSLFNENILVLTALSEP